MNNLMEMWNLYDFVCQGNVLGQAATFRREFADVITRGTDKRATPHDKKLGVVK
jgi:DNA excision repair protein ERCC-6-like